MPQKVTFSFTDVHFFHRRSLTACSQMSPKSERKEKPSCVLTFSFLHYLIYSEVSKQPLAPVAKRSSYHPVFLDEPGVQINAFPLQPFLLSLQFLKNNSNKNAQNPCCASKADRTWHRLLSQCISGCCFLGLVHSISETLLSDHPVSTPFGQRQ